MLKRNVHTILPYCISVFFFVAYAILSVRRHMQFGSFGFDLGIADQIVWLYSQFMTPITTIDHVPFISELFVHLEFIYIFLSPFYWLYDNVITLLILQAGFFAASGIPIFFLSRSHTKNKYIPYALMISYLMFYGVQHALWFDVHSTVFGASFLAWFIYFIDQKKILPSLIFFFLTIICKENYAAMTFLVSFSYFLHRKEKMQIIFMLLSLVYLIVVFGLFFQYIVPGGYRFSSKQGLFSGISLFHLINTSEKMNVFFYTFFWTGLLSVLQPVFLIPLIGNLASYFILGREVSTAQGLFLQYRIELAPLLLLSTIYGIKRMPLKNLTWVAGYLIACAIFFQYVMHLPLSYLTKKYFWQHIPVESIHEVISYIPANASVVAQNNIIPHLSHRNNIFTLWPDKRNFYTYSPCGDLTCNWFRWVGTPDYLVVDIRETWDIRHLLTHRSEYVDGLVNMEKTGVIQKYKQIDTSIVYKIIKHP